MNIDDIEIVPIASESLGVRSLCTFIRTPDISILLDPSAALAKRSSLEPHPLEYRQLQQSLEVIRARAEEADILSISHYHYDHVRPGFRNCLYNLSTRQERKEMFTGKKIFAKDNRESINNSQRRRAYFFHKDVKNVCEELDWCDGKSYEFGKTLITYSKPLPHGPEDSPLGYVLATAIEYEATKVVFAPDVQGPISRRALNFILSFEPTLAIVGGPPTYLSKFKEEESQSAIFNLTTLASVVPILVVDHHNMRDSNWANWIATVKNIATQSNNSLLSMAALSDLDERCLESNRSALYREHPPSSDFIDWTNASDEYKLEHLPPL